MSDASGNTPRLTDPIGRALYVTADALAIIGGLLCFGMALMVTVSVTGRYLFAAPVPGDYDLAGILGGTAIFAFLPWCQMRRGNVVVDFFTTRAGPRLRAALDAFGSILFVVIAGLFTWRLWYGMVELRESGEVLAVVNFYRWWTLPFDIFCVAVLALTVAWTLARDIRAVVTGVPVVAESDEAWRHE
jgi:TRAP-type C4-dicarboxylate transport system permease small subunit